MEFVEGAVQSLMAKLQDLLVGEYNLRKGERGQIMFLKAEFESIHKNLDAVPVQGQPNHQVKLLAREVTELCYDIEDSVDAIVVLEGNELSRPHGLERFIDRTVHLLTRTKIYIDKIRRIREVLERRDMYKLSARDMYKLSAVNSEPATVTDPRLLAQYIKVRDQLVGIDKKRDELIKILMEGNHGKIISVVGFGGLGKTTLAMAVYETLRTQFDCCAFVSVSQNPDVNKLFKSMLYQLGMKNNTTIIEVLDEPDLMGQLRKFLEEKSYFIVIDDIWSISAWEIIRCALPHNDCGYRIITTTRILNVATVIGGAYKLVPLSLHNSRILFYKTMFGHEDQAAKCLDDELAEVSDKILEKCAGLPMAIITIASLLASKARNKMEWYSVYRSIGAGLKNSLDLENMRMILLSSYYDLPSHLRACLLYLSMFPEHYDIEKDRLIRLWIAEGLIGTQESLFQVGERYFDELIKRSMIRPVYRWNSTVIEFCQVHDMVLDLICSLSSEGNFVSISNTMHHASPTVKVRRLSIQNGNAGHGATMSSMKQARSVVAFPSAVDLMPYLESFLSLRVLDLEGCHLSQGYNLKYLGKMFHLRYLGLRDTGIAQLPNEIGKLQFLQTLDLRGNEISSLPSTIAQLKGLMFLLIGSWTRTPEGIGHLSSLQELSTLCISDSPSTIEELGHLMELRILSIDCRIGWKNVLGTSLVECLHKLQKIERLSISVFGECNLDAWVAPPRLQRLELTGCWSSVLSSWMNPSLLLNLSFLSIEMKKLQQEDLETLGRLPALSYLDLEVNHENIEILGTHVVGASSFPGLIQCVLRGCIEPVAFQQGAMPRLESLCFTFPVLKMREIANCDGNFNLGLGNLQSLRNVTVSFLSEGATVDEVEEAEGALRNAVQMHPNHPSLEIH